MKLAETVNETLVEMIEGDVVKEIIQKQLESTITDVVSDSMRSYSDFGKVIKEKINQVVNIAASNVELPEYTKFVSGVVIEQFDKVLHEQAKTQLEKLINKELGALNQDSITCSQLFDKLRSSFESDEHQDERDISVEVTRSDYGSIYITIKDDEKK